MPEQESKSRPDWADRERAGDLGWIRENLDMLWPMAQQGYQAIGRGAVMVDTTVEIIQSAGIGHRAGYFDQATLESLADEDTQRLVAAYEPREEFVTSLLKSENRVSCYRLRVIDGAREPLDDRLAEAFAGQPALKAELEPPDIATLMDWEAAGGCEAACPYHCWVEGDGTCEHGNPSWLIVMGLI